MPEGVEEADQRWEKGSAEHPTSEASDPQTSVLSVSVASCRKVLPRAGDGVSFPQHPAVYVRRIILALGCGFCPLLPPADPGEGTKRAA